MNKQQAMSYGVTENAYRMFQEHYNRDVNKRSQEIAQRHVDGETAYALGLTREAIASMIALIDDVPTLQRMLTSVNRIYSDYIYKQQHKSAENNQETTPNTPETTGTTETGAGGVAGCP